MGNLTSKVNQFKMAIAFVALASFTILTSFLMARMADSYTYANNYLYQSREIEKIFGSVENTFMLPRYSWHSNGADGYADYDIFVIGSNKNAVVHMSLSENTGQWLVTNFEY